MKPNVTTFVHKASFTMTHIVQEPNGRHCAIIDPALDYDPASSTVSSQFADQLIEHIKSNELIVDWILETHAHADHLSAGAYLKSKLGGCTAIGEYIVDVQNTWKQLFNFGEEFKTDGSQFDHLFKEGEKFSIGAMEGCILYTPGHTQADITYLIGDAAFIGDTLFMPDCGTARTDFPGGDTQSLYQSVQRLFALPAKTRLFLCHDYFTESRQTHQWQISVAEQREQNIHINSKTTEQDFVGLRIKRNKMSSAPRLLLPSVQTNIRAGELPLPEVNGQTYFKIPVRWV